MTKIRTGLFIAIAVALAGFGQAARATMFELTQTLPNPTPANGDQFGQDVSISGARALIGAPFDGTGGSGAGSAYLFDTGTGALLRTIVNPFPGPTANDFFGQAVSLSGDRALIGASFDDTTGTNSGSAYVFDVNTGNLLRTLSNPGAAPTASDQFGLSLSLFGDKALIGAIGDDTGASNAGAAYLFNIDTGALLRSFFNPTPAIGDNFGISVSLFGDKALIGAHFDDTGASNAGAAYLFDINSSVPLKTFLNPTPAVNDTFGSEVSLSADKALIGAIQDDTAAFNAGAAYIFDLATGNRLHTLTKPGATGEEFLGEAVALSGNLALVGAAFDNTGANDTGAAYLFDANTGALLQAILNPVPGLTDRFGKGLALDGSQALIGAQTDLVGTTRPGTAYVYRLPPRIAVPEPGSLAFMAACLLGIMYFAGRRPRRASDPNG